MSAPKVKSEWGGEAGWAGSGDHQIEEIHTPDMAAIIDGEEEDADASEITLAGEIMRGILSYVFADRKDSNGQPRLDVAFRRFVCVTWLLRPELLGNITLTELAPELGVTKAALSAMIRRFGDTYGIRNAFQKLEGAREAYSQAQKRDHWRHRKSKEPVAPEETTGPAYEHLMNEGTRHSEDSV